MAKYRTPLTLSEDERTFLLDFTRKGVHPAREIKRARLLLDTHALLWWAAGDPKIPRRTRTAVADEANEVAVSARAWGKGSA